MPRPQKRQRPRVQKPRTGKTETPPDTTAPVKPGLVRLQRVLAGAGCGSRRACEELITEGRVMIDEVVVTTLGVKVDPNRQSIHLDGRRLKLEKKVYFAVNKPPGYLCTNNDPAGRKRVIDLLPHVSERLFTVGRLDEGSQGLIVVTNDGTLSQKLAHPSFGVRKVYRVLVAGTPTHEELQNLRTGMQFHEGKFKVDAVREIRPVGQATLLEIVLREGKNREIRRLLAKIGHKVMRLQRVELGPLRLGTLKLGACRLLTRDEVQRLRRGDQPSGNEESTRSKPGADKRQSKRPVRPTETKSPAVKKTSGTQQRKPATPPRKTGKRRR